jgi:8-oxo-dGTP diphosphatase
VDVANVMGSRPDGWWRDRAGAAVRLYGEIARLAASGRVVLPGAAEPADHAEFVLVLEGAAKAAAATIRAPAAGQDAAAAEAGPDAAAAPDAAAPDTQEAEDAKAGRIRVVEAPRSGDDTIVALVRELNMLRAVVVVTADRELGDRCRAAGATVLGPGWLLRLLGP